MKQLYFCKPAALAVALFAVWQGLPLHASNTATNPHSCEPLAQAAAQRHDVPGRLMLAIARTESGRTSAGAGYGAWPWTLNIEGKPHYFDSAEHAMAQLEQAIAAGKTNVDVGCMQINYRWHGAEFPSLHAMLDPASNTDYAARLLARLHRQKGSWADATQNYHSAKPARGLAYLQRVQAHMAKLADLPSPAPSAQPPQPRDPRPFFGQAVGQAVADRRFSGGQPLVALESQGSGGGDLRLPVGTLPDVSAVRAGMAQRPARQAAKIHH